MNNPTAKGMPSAIPADITSSDEVLHQALALGTGDLLRTSFNAYTAYVSEALDQLPQSEASEALFVKLVDKGKNGVANRNSFKRTLLSSLAQDVMFIIWRESDFVSDEALSAAALGRRFQEPEKHLTINSLKNAVFDDLRHMNGSAGDALRKQVERICDALEVYGLIERTTIRDNLKPIQATHRLHDLMMFSNTSVSHIFAQQLQENEDDCNG